MGSVACSALPVARGTVASAHGTLPFPAPATLELLRGAALVGVDGEGELVTPTGATLAATFASSFGALPPFVLDSVGTIDLPDQPNLLRVLIGRSEGQVSAADVSLLGQTSTNVARVIGIAHMTVTTAELARGRVTFATGPTVATTAKPSSTIAWPGSPRGEVTQRFFQEQMPMI